ncbi:hypothetical protein HY78_14635 [Rhizorhabdus wittichii DC-6]|nr:hypothetical protein HY78_14635 [Rhizorhabdus wittichii DC-6]
MITIVYGSAGTGMSHHSQAIRRHFRSRRVIDGWSAFDDHAVNDGDLLLTNDPPMAIYRSPALKGNRLHLWHIDAVLREIRAEAKPTGGDA